MYYWIDSDEKPVQIPAITFIQLVQKWIISKISDPALFPMDLTSLASYARDLNDSNMNTPIPADPTDIKTPLSFQQSIIG